MSFGDRGEKISIFLKSLFTIGMVLLAGERTHLDSAMCVTQFLAPLHQIEGSFHVVVILYLSTCLKKNNRKEREKKERKSSISGVLSVIPGDSLLS